MELENMKKKLLAALLFFNLLICGCAFDISSSTSNTQDTQTVTEKKTSTKVDEEQPQPVKSKQDKESSSVDSKTPDQKSTDSSVEKQEATDTPDKATDTPDEDTATPGEDTEDKDDSSVSKTPGQKPDDPTAEKKPESEPQPQPQPQPFRLLGDNPVMMAILALLIVMILTLSWLVYDRHKMKRKLNNLSSIQPSESNNSPQTVNSPAQSPTTIRPTPLSHPMNSESLTIRVDNLQHIGSRKEQQDSFCVSNIGDKKAINEKGLLAVVADGMGGLEGGALISHLVTDTFLDSYNNQLSFEPASFLYNTAESSERAVEDYINQTGINGGSTLVAVIVKDSQLNYISVGDSHIYLLRDRTLTQINKEHSLGALLKEKADKGEIDPSEPYTNPKRNALTAYIGMGSFNVVDKNTQPIFLKAGDKVLLCSDGVYNALGNDALIVALAGDASTAARRIQADILAQNIPSQDNFTAIVLECVRA